MMQRVNENYGSFWNCQLLVHGISLHSLRLLLPSQNHTDQLEPVGQAAVTQQHWSRSPNAELVAGLTAKSLSSEDGSDMAAQLLKLRAVMSKTSSKMGFFPIYNSSAICKSGNNNTVKGGTQSTCEKKGNSPVLWTSIWSADFEGNGRLCTTFQSTLSSDSN